MLGIRGRGIPALPCLRRRPWSSMTVSRTAQVGAVAHPHSSSGLGDTPYMNNEMACNGEGPIDLTRADGGFLHMWRSSCSSQCAREAGLAPWRRAVPGRGMGPRTGPAPFHNRTLPSEVRSNVWETSSRM